MSFDPQQIYIITDILNIVFLTSAIALAILFLIIIVFSKDCRTKPMFLASNTSIAVIVYASSMLGNAILGLNNDREQVSYQDSLCHFRGYVSYVGNGSLLFSFTLQALYRYFIVMHSTRLFWQSFKFQIFLVCFCWILMIGVLLPGLYTGDIAYDVGSHACAVLFRPSVLLFFNMSVTYLIPISLFMLMYFKLFRYVRQIGRRVITVQRVLRIQREFMMVRRIVLIILFLIFIGTPYCVFALLSIFTPAPIYSYRISIFFIDLGQTFVMIALFVFSQPIINVLRKLSNSVNPTAP